MNLRRFVSFLGLQRNIKTGRLPHAEPSPELRRVYAAYIDSRTARQVNALAVSDADFDGRPFAGLSRADKLRYLKRAERGVKAVLKIDAL